MAFALLNGDGAVVMTVAEDTPGFVEIADDDPRLATFNQVSAAQIAFASKLGDGLAVTSSSTPALNATYALDDASVAQIFQLGLYANGIGSFPSGAALQEYPDRDGTLHAFNVTQFVALLRAVAPLVSALETQMAIMQTGGTPSWPAQTAAI